MRMGCSCGFRWWVKDRVYEERLVGDCMDATLSCTEQALYCWQPKVGRRVMGVILRLDCNLLAAVHVTGGRRGMDGAIAVLACRGCLCGTNRIQCNALTSRGIACF